MYSTRAFWKKNIYESQILSVCIAKGRNVVTSCHHDVTPVVSMTTRLIYFMFATNFTYRIPPNCSTPSNCNTPLFLGHLMCYVMNSFEDHNVIFI